MKNFNIIFSLAVLLLTSCKKDTTCAGDGAAPGPITAPQVENLHGSARISYTLPNDPSLLYVKAEWEANGTKREAKSSMYTNSVLLEGFGDTLEHAVKLYAVSRCENLSSAVDVTVKPLPPSIHDVYESLDVIPAFGGINISYTNVEMANIVIGILVKDSTGYWQHVDFHYSSQAQNDFSVRGFKQNPPPQTQIEYTFGIYVKDRWDNHTDTLVKIVAPIYEELIDKSNFKDIRGSHYPVPQIAPLPLSGDPIVNAVDYSSSYKLVNLWDDNVSKMFHSKQNYDQPVWVPIDLDNTGTNKFKLSRFKIWQRPAGYAFNHGNPHTWEIWGTNDPTNVNSWVKLGGWTMKKPSGRPVGDNTNEDEQVAADGQDYDFPASIPAVRYIAWKNIDCWSAIGGATGFLHMEELTLWGQKQ